MSATTFFSHQRITSISHSIFIALALASCGGNLSDSATTTKIDSTIKSILAPAKESTLSTGISSVTMSSTFGQAKSAAEIDKAKLAIGGFFQKQAQNRVIATTGQAELTTAVVPQILGTPAPVYRFYNTVSGAHFFTISEVEKNYVKANYPQFQFEGPAFLALQNTEAGLSPVHRFYNNSTGTHFFTIDEAEKTAIIAKWPTIFTYEGISWYANTAAGAGWIPLYRFYNTSKGTHFYTTNLAERDSIIANLKQFSYEGTGYYVKEPSQINLDTGVTSSQCYQAGSDVLVSCTSAGALALNNTQDGMVGFDVTEPSNTDGKLGFSYEAVTGGCVKDKRTGLTWEVKTADGGLRDMNKIYTNYDDATKAQISGGDIPTLAQINAATNTVGFAAAVNATSLCGFSDWRLPMANELQGIVDYGVLASPSIDPTWFPNTVVGNYWSSSPFVVFSQYVWGIDFTYGHMSYPYRTAGSVRLVRGSSVVLAPRYSYSSDGSEVIDSKTGLTWQRCRVDWAWNGSACVGGFPAFFTHEQALAQAKTQAANSGKAWRLPNVKELSSIADVTQSPAVDKIAFPNTANNYWSSSPFGNFALTWAVNLNYGNLEGQSRGAINSVRLVRTTP
jgi:Protein of unknown function (DUF1566)/Repeat of unknown function (DUF5648)